MKIQLTKNEMRDAAFLHLSTRHNEITDVNQVDYQPIDYWIDDNLLAKMATTERPKIACIKLLRLMNPNLGLLEAKLEIEKRYPNLSH